MKNQNIEVTNWLTEGISQEQLKAEKTLAVISAKIYTKRTKMGLDQKAFAKYMGVTQGMVSRWESGTYNFSITTLITICEKLNLSFEPDITEKGSHIESVVFVRNTGASFEYDNFKKWDVPKSDLTIKGAA